MTALEAPSGIDFTALDKLYELDPGKADSDLVPSLLSTFLEHLPADILGLQSSSLKKDHKDLAMKAHTLKSSSATIGAMKLSACCKALEELGKSESDFEVIQKWVSKLSAESEFITQILTAYLKNLKTT